MHNVFQTGAKIYLSKKERPLKIWSQGAQDANFGKPSENTDWTRKYNHFRKKAKQS